jgi:hypothetical protein
MLFNGNNLLDQFAFIPAWHIKPAHGIETIVGENCDDAVHLARRIGEIAIVIANPWISPTRPPAL